MLDAGRDDPIGSGTVVRVVTRVEAVSSTAVATVEEVYVRFDGCVARYVGELKPREGGAAAGGCDARVPHGWGRCIYGERDEMTYEGEFVEGRRHGRGEWVRHGARYCGDFYEGDAHGRGTYTSADGAVYEGEWRHNRRHGVGRDHYPPKDGVARLRYEGEWHADERHGSGAKYAATGRLEYDGEWRRGKRHGTGRYVFSDGSDYVGEWRDGVRHGSGARRWADGAKHYVGGYVNGRRHGDGVEFAATTGRWACDERFRRAGQGVECGLEGLIVYRGQWRDGAWHGEGTVYDDGGRAVYSGAFERWCFHGVGRLWDERGALVYEGMWESDARCGEGTSYYASDAPHHAPRREYVGEWRADERHGYGTLYDGDPAKGWRYRGDWIDGKRHGRGQAWLREGVLYDGDFERDEAHGQGTLYHPNGRELYRGDFRDGVRHGQGTEYHQNGRVRYEGPWADDTPDRETRKRQRQHEARVVKRRRRIVQLHEDGLVPPLAKCAMCYDELFSGVERYVYVPCGHLAMCGPCRDKLAPASRWTTTCMLCKTSDGWLMRVYD